MTTIFQSSTPANNPKLQYAVPDNLLKGYGTEAGTTDGVFLFRLDDKRSFPLQATPASPADAAILNLANNISAQASLGGDVAAFTWNAARKSLTLNSRSAPVTCKVRAILWRGLMLRHTRQRINISR